jgi:cell division septation protein DedD/ketosteroid isomerase-like protein
MRGMTFARRSRLPLPLLFLVLALALALALPAQAGADAAASLDASDEARVRTLIERWLEAQNKGDFVAYRELYMPSFHGVRRSGGRTVVLDYPGWLRDRQRMFKKPMKVTATDVRVAREGGLMRATFVQEFSSGNYADRGRKQIDFALVSGSPIAREELLDSELLPAKNKPRATTAAAAAPVDTAAAAAAREEAACPTAKAEPFSGTFKGEPGWLVVGETSADAAAITARALKQEAAGVEAHPIATDSFEGLKPGLFCVVHGAFATREEAQALVESLREKKIKAFAKESGPLHGGGRLVEIRGVATRNGTRGRWPLLVTTDDGGEGTVKAAASGQFVMWMATTGKLDIQNEAETPEKDNMRAAGGVCIHLTPATRGRVDVGVLDTTTWSCGY